MADTEPSGRPAEINTVRNLPATVTRTGESDSDGFFKRLARALFGWRGGTTRADIEVVLEAAVPGETGV